MLERELVHSVKCVLSPTSENSNSVHLAILLSGAVRLRVDPLDRGTLNLLGVARVPFL